MNNDFGKLLRELRNSRGYSVNQLADKSGVSAAHISRLENELRPAPSPRTIAKLAKVLGGYQELMAAAGYLDEKAAPQPKSLNDYTIAFARKLHRLSPEGQKKVHEFMEMVEAIEKQKQRQK